MVFKIALKNLLAAGLRTWLNVLVLSLTLASIIFLQGLMAGMLDEMSSLRIAEEIGGGQLWHQAYDPFDPMTLEESRSKLPAALQRQVEQGAACPVLLLSGGVYVKGRYKNVLLKGVSPEQRCLALDFSPLAPGPKDSNLKVMIGRNFAKQLDAATGELITLRWRTQAGAINALDAEVAGLLKTQVPAMDQGQIYLSREVLNQLNQTQDFSSLLWVEPGATPTAPEGWVFREVSYLMRDTLEMVQTKSAGQSFFFALLLFLGLIAVFDTQALAVFRRKKEIGTFMALGMSHAKVVLLFVVEGTLHGLLATLVTLLWAGPLFYWSTQVGLDMGISGEDFGMALGQVFYPVFGWGKVMAAVLLVNAMVVLVSFWPVRVIAKMSPADALRGRM